MRTTEIHTHFSFVSFSSLLVLVRLASDDHYLLCMYEFANNLYFLDMHLCTRTFLWVNAVVTSNMYDNNLILQHCSLVSISV